MIHFSLNTVNSRNIFGVPEASSVYLDQPSIGKNTLANFNFNEFLSLIK